ncbi:hypothetical protein [Klebsiella pneumoniae]|uniref:hypothetical protein n=1 Tax=Klebsiella pneumoniae TaxID=573 RepID=UPI0038F7FD12
MHNNGYGRKYCAYCRAVSGLAAFLDAWQKVGESRKRAKRYLTAMPASIPTGQ